jgi:flavin-dependent dehydrogenase
MSSELSGPLQVIGAGPAGLAAAILGRKAGRRVVVFERHRDVGCRFHGDFQGLENWSGAGDVLEELAGLGIEPTFKAIPLTEQVCYGPDGREHVFRSAQPFYYLITRGPAPGTLDHSLKQQALAAGAEIRFGEPVREPPAGAVVASGPHRADVLAVGYLFETDLADGSFAVLDDRLAPRGYGYLLVHGGRATLATCLFRDFANHAAYLERTAEFFYQRLRFSMHNSRRFGGVGMVRWQPRAASEPALHAGEAAGVQDALWGFGIRYAILSGQHAARLALDAARRAVHRRWEETVGNQLRTGFVNRYFFDRLGRLGYQLLFWGLSRSQNPRRSLRRLYRSAAWKRALFPFIHGSHSREPVRRTPDSAEASLPGCSLRCVPQGEALCPDGLTGRSSGSSGPQEMVE